MLYSVYAILAQHCHKLYNRRQLKWQFCLLSQLPPRVSLILYQC